MTSLRLYSRPDCHLCEEAAEIVMSHRPGVELVEINIEDDLEHLDRYGVRIPVLQRADTAAELYWPFGLDELERFLS